MFSFAILAIASLATSVNALAVPKPPSYYAQGYLEDYATYHLRYEALDCWQKHKTQFFNDCCHPLLATENLKDNRKAYCTPTAKEIASASAHIAAVPTGVADPASDTSDGPENVAAAPSDPAPAPAPAPKPTEDPKPAAPAPKPAPAPASNNNGGGFGAVHTGGIATFFFQHGVAGACGTVHQDTDHVVALHPDLYQNGANCGKTIRVQGNGKTVDATVADECPTCDGANSIDLSVSLFENFASQSAGIFNVDFAIQ